MLLTLLPETFAVCRLAPFTAVPDWATAGSFFSITRTADELSVVCQQSNVPTGVQAEPYWRAFKLEGPIDFTLTGVLYKLTEPLAQAQIGIFAISTYDTDYLLVKDANLLLAIEALTQAGYTVS